MATYSLGVIPIENLTFLQNEPDWSRSWANNNGMAWENASSQGDIAFTLPRHDLTTITVDDTDTQLGDDPAVSWVDGQGVIADQMLSESVTVGGVSYPAGTMVENEYEISLTGDDGITYRLAAVSLSLKENPDDPNSSYLDQVNVGFTFDGDWPPEGVTLTYVPGSAQDLQELDQANMSLCFAAGTMLATPHGEVAIEDLREGDLVLTRDHGAQPIRWIGKTVIGAARLAVSPQLRPIRIKAGALGDNSPASDLVVSPQHRVLVRSKIAQRMFGTSEILVAARQLLQLDGIDIAGDLAGVEYFHMLFDRHEVVVSNGAETESLFTGPQALKALGRAARDEIFAIFPELRDAGAVIEAARPMVSGRKGRKLALRHAQAGRALVA